MTHTELESIIDKTLPLNTGILLTGGQRYNNPFGQESDIDVVVVDFSFSNVYGFVIPHGSYKIDITIVPFLNMENILLNEANDPKGGLLTMINMGVSIKDKFGVFPLLQEKAGALLQEIGGKTFELYQGQVNELMRYIKHFDKPLTQKQKSVLACDVMTTISTIESIKSSNWVSKKHKLDLFSEESDNTICAELHTIFEKGIVEKNFSELAEFTNYYCRTSNSLPPFPVSSVTRILIDLDYADFSMPHFINTLLPAITTHESLKEAFTCFYMSPRQQHKTYKNKICLSFRIKNHMHAAELIKIIDAVFVKTLISGFRFAVVFQNNRQYNEESFTLLEELRIAINQFIIKALSLQRYTPGSLVHHCILLGGIVTSSMRLNNMDISKGNTFLIQHSLFSIDEQRQLNDFSHLKKIQEAKFQHAMGFYQQHRTTIMDHCNNGILLSLASPVSTDMDYQPILTALNNIIARTDFFDHLENNLTYLALKQVQSEVPGLLLVYTAITQEFMQFFNLPDSEKIIYLVCLSKAMTELKAT